MPRTVIYFALLVVLFCSWACAIGYPHVTAEGQRVFQHFVADPIGEQLPRAALNVHIVFMTHLVSRISSSTLLRRLGSSLLF